MNDKNDNHLNMQPNKDNNDYYIMQLNELINDILIIDKRPVKIMNMQQKQRGCWDWFLSKITFWKKDDSSKEKQTFVGLINIGNNCYLNAGLQILSRCYPLVKVLLESNYQEDKLMKLFVEAMVTLLFNKDKIYDPTEFIKCFCERNEDFTPGKPQCSQDFVRTILRNINETFEKNVMYEYYNPSEEEEKKMYESLILKNNIRFEDYCPNTTEENNAYKKFISQNKIISESKAYSIFSGILKITITI